MAALYTVQGGKIQKYRSYFEAFGLNVVDNIQIAAIGSGGKSTILSEIAKEYIKANRTVISTTTTHIWKPDRGVFEEDIQKVKESLKKNPFVIVGNHLDNTQKLSLFYEFIRIFRWQLHVQGDSSPKFFIFASHFYSFYRILQRFSQAFCFFFPIPCFFCFLLPCAVFPPADSF